MARILFHNKTRLYGVNYANRDFKANTAFHTFEGNRPIQVETLYQCPSNRHFDFTLNGFVFQEVSPELIEIIN